MHPVVEFVNSFPDLPAKCAQISDLSDGLAFAHVLTQLYLFEVEYHEI